MTQSICAQTGAPEIVAQSDDIVTFEGNQITLRVQLSDETERPIETIWWMNGTAIPGATEILTFLPKAGAYWFTVSNRLGMATSRVIRVTVVEVTGVSGQFQVAVPSGGKFTVILLGSGFPDQLKVRVAADGGVESEGLYYGVALRRRPDPWIRFERAGEGVLLRWGNGLLEGASSVRGPWTWIRVTSPSTQPRSGSMRFFRVRAAVSVGRYGQHHAQPGELLQSFGLRVRHEFDAGSSPHLRDWS